MFDNDTACDWAYELEGVKDLSVIERALDKILGQADALIDASEAQEALAAAETLARLRGSPGVSNSYTEAMDAWVRRMSKLTPSPALVHKARLSIDRILTEPSELLDAWNDPEVAARWRTGVLELKTRIVDPPSGAAGPSSPGARPWWRIW